MLPLSPFEEYMLIDDGANYPMSCFARLRFSGKLKPLLVRNALEQVVQRHPLLRSVVVEPRKNRFYWSLTENRGEFVLFETTDSEQLPYIPRIDLFNEPGIRLYYITRTLEDSSGKKGKSKINTTTELLFQVHHSCCDGVGFTQVIDDWLRIYAIEIGAADASILGPAPNPQTLKRRGKHSWNLSYFLQQFWVIPSRCVGIVLFALRFLDKATSLVPISRDQLRQELPNTFPSVVYRTIQGEHLSELRAAARKKAVSFNDLLMRDLFLSLGRFRDKYYPSHAHKNISLSIPMNMRSHVTETEHVSNIVSMVFIDQKVPDDETPDGLLKKIRRTMNRTKLFGFGSVLTGILKICQFFPGFLRYGIRQHRVWATCVLSNIGQMLQHTPLPTRDGKIQLGNVELQGIDEVPPIRPWTAVSMGVATYADKMSLALHYDEQFLSREQAEELHNLFMDRLQMSCEEEFGRKIA